MPRRDRVILELDPPFDAAGTGVFVMQGSLDDTTEIERQYIAAARGQYVKEIYREASEYFDSVEAPDEDSRRRGFTIDGGAGRVVHTVSFTRGVNEDSQWGDGSTDPADPSDYSKYDATGVGVWPQRDIFEFWLTNVRADSGGQARLYISEWSDGTYADTPGVFGEPMTVSINSVTIEKPEDDPAEFAGTIEFALTEPVGDLGDLAEGVKTTLQNSMPEWG
jgi:hypothetical protein